MKKVFIATSMLLVSTITLASAQETDPEWTISSIETKEITNSKSSLSNHLYSGLVDGGVDGGTTGGTTTAPAPRTIGERAEEAGQVIGVLKDIVALGESVYELIKKGKPTNTTEYAPISIVPKDLSTNAPVDPFELENFSMPIEKKYTTVIKNGLGKRVVTIEYMVIFSYGGSYNGAGKYITAAQIVPTSIDTAFMWDVNATMKLGGIMNHGTKDSPIAGAILGIKYQMSSWGNAFERNDMIHITGNGQIKATNR